MKYIHSAIDVYEGETARPLLVARNDAKWHGPDGVVSVDTRRWRDALAAECSGWLIHWTNQDNDRADEHVLGFNEYQAAPSNLGDVIEIGCGPFSQLNTLLQRREAKSITLLDPLAYRYLSHPKCAYRTGKLQGKPLELVQKRAEDLGDIEKYDTAVMINVLEHCQNADAVLANLNRCLRPGGTLIFHERAWDEYDPTSEWDVHHPLRVKQQYLDRFLGNYVEGYRRGNYFIGKKRSTATAGENNVG